MDCIWKYLCLTLVAGYMFSFHKIFVSICRWNKQKKNAKRWLKRKKFTYFKTGYFFKYLNKTQITKMFYMKFYKNLMLHCVMTVMSSSFSMIQYERHFSIPQQDFTVFIWQSLTIQNPKDKCLCYIISLIYLYKCM